MRLVDTDNLTLRLREFVAERAWGEFHNPKNLALALAGEVGELCAEFQWLTPEEATSEEMTADRKAATAAEIADVLIYTVQLADRLDIDLNHAVEKKIAGNARRYPVDRSRGRAGRPDSE